MENKQLIISVGREYGSEGHKIAEKLAEHFAIPLYDKDFLKAVLEDKGIEDSEIHKFDENKKKFGIYRAVRGMDSSPESLVAHMQFEFLKKKAKKGESFVIVGRCAETVLRDCPALISIFVLGDKEEKINHIAEVYDISPKKAEKLMIEKNDKRKKYHNHYCEGKWGDSRNYDISINSSKLGVDETVRVLIDYIKTRKKV